MKPIIGNTMSGIVSCCIGVNESHHPMKLCAKHSTMRKMRQQPPPHPPPRPELARDPWMVLMKISAQPHTKRIEKNIGVMYPFMVAIKEMSLKFA